MSLILGLSDVSSQWGSDCAFLKGIPRSCCCVLLSSSHQGRHDIHVSHLPLEMLTLTTWVRWGLSSPSTIELLFFSLKSLGILWENYINTLFLTKPFSHWFYTPIDHFLLGSVITMKAAKWWFSNSIITSFISWNFTVRQSFFFSCIYLFVNISINLHFLF